MSAWPKHPFRSGALEKALAPESWHANQIPFPPTSFVQVTFAPPAASTWTSNTSASPRFDPGTAEQKRPKRQIPPSVEPLPWIGAGSSRISFVAIGEDVYEA